MRHLDRILWYIIIICLLIIAISNVARAFGGTDLSGCPPTDTAVVSKFGDPRLYLRQPKEIHEYGIDEPRYVVSWILDGQFNEALVDSWDEVLAVQMYLREQVQ